MSLGSFVVDFTLVHFSCVLNCIFNIKMEDVQLQLLVSVYIHVFLNGLIMTRVQGRNQLQRNKIVCKMYVVVTENIDRQWIAINFLPIETSLIEFLTNVNSGPDMNVQELISSGSRVTAGNVHCSSCKVLLVLYLWQLDLNCFQRRKSGCPDLKFQKNPYNGS